MPLRTALAPKPAPAPLAPPARHASPAAGPKRPGHTAAASATAAAPAEVLADAPGASVVAQYLAAKGAPVLMRGASRLQRLRRNEQTHDDAGQKLDQSERAVDLPASEGQSTSNAQQVNAVDERRKPVVEAQRARNELQSTLAANIPRTIENVDNFQSDQKAQHMSADVLKVVQGDKNAVLASFVDLTITPQPAPPAQKPQGLPPPEPAPPTAALHLGAGAVAPLQKEHTDVSAYTQQADGKLKEEGITQEQLDMVDSGDLAAANREKKTMAKMAVEEPAAVGRFAQQETARVDRELGQDEQQGRAELRRKRAAGLGATAQKQKDTRTALERKRGEVAAKINGMYKSAQETVKKKLDNLEKQSMQKFEQGNAQAAATFEERVNREFAAYKKERYSGRIRGTYRRARDWFKGMDDLPGVKAIFERNRNSFVTTINKLVEEITADNKRVIQECKTTLAQTRQKIKQFVAELAPGLKTIGKQAEEEMDSKLDALDASVGQRARELQGKLKNKQNAAIRAIDQKIEKMKEAMSGALAKFGRLLLQAAKKFFAWVLEQAGFSLSTIENVINQGVAVLKAIFTEPIAFVKRLVSAAATGFQSFGKNFLKHLQDALFGWLTGSLSGLTLPSTWDSKGVLSVIFQLLHLTYANIRRHLLKLLPEEAVQALKTDSELVKTLIAEGPLAAWEQLKELAADLKQAFSDAIANWLKWKVIEEAIKTILAMFTPGAGLPRAIIAIYDIIVFFIQKAKQIFEMIAGFLGSIGQIAAGNIAAAAEALEDGLVLGLRLVIDFLARFLRLSGITDKIRQVINAIGDRVDAALAKVAAWIVKGGGSAARTTATAARSAATTVQRGVQAVLQWWRRKMRVGTGEKAHTISFRGNEDTAQLYIESTPRLLREYLASLSRDPDYADANQVKIIDRVLRRINRIEQLESELRTAKSRGHVNVAESKAEEINAGFDYIGGQLGQLFTGDSYGTESDPIPLDWPGPRSSEYPRLYFGGFLPVSRRPKAQSVLKNIYARGLNDETGEPVREYLPERRTPLAGGGGVIGLTSPFFIRRGRVVGPLSQETTGGGKALGDLIVPYGYSGGDGFDLDHVREVQFGGLAQNDRVENLWPLESSKNRRKGSVLSSAEVEYPKGHTTQIPTLKLIRNDDVRKRKKFYFRIASTE